MRFLHLAAAAAGAALALAPAAASAAVKSGAYEGETDQSRSVSFVVKKGKVVDFQAGVMTFCLAGGDNSFETDAVADVPPMKIARNGRFTWTAPDDADGVIEMTVTGRITGGKAKGTVVLRRPHSSYDPSAGMTMFGQCSADRPWKAKRG